MKINKVIKPHLQIQTATLILFSICMLAVCHNTSALSIDEEIFCDQYKNQKCLLPFEDSQRIYEPEIPLSKSKTWYDLGYHMYFHTRQTPGLYIKFSRELNEDEMEVLRKSLRCEMILEKSGQVLISHMEGVRIAQDGIWCFDYLGSNLVQFMKKAKMESAQPELDFFPLKMKITYSSDLKPVNGLKKTLIYIQWKIRQ